MGKRVEKHLGHWEPRKLKWTNGEKFNEHLVVPLSYTKDKLICQWLSGSKQIEWYRIYNLFEEQNGPLSLCTLRT